MCQASALSCELENAFLREHGRSDTKQRESKKYFDGLNIDDANRSKSLFDFTSL